MRRSKLRFFSLKTWLILFIAGLILITFLIWALGIFRIPMLRVSGFEAVPNNSAYILQFNDYNKTKETLKKTAYYKDMNKLSTIKKIGEDVAILERLFYAHENYKSIFIAARMLVAAQVSGADSYDYIYVFDKYEKDFELKDFLKSFSDIEVQESVFRNRRIFEVKLGDGKRVTFCKYKGVLICARKAFLVEYAVEQLSEIKSGLPRKNDFSRINQLTGNSGDMSVFINPESFPLFSNIFYNKDKKYELEFFKRFVSWGGIDIIFKEKGIMYNAYIHPVANNRFQKALQKQKNPVSSELDKVIPNNAALVTSFHFTDFSQFFNKLEAKESDDFENYILPWIGEEIAYMIMEPFSTSYNGEKFIIMKADNLEKADKLMREFANNYGELEKEVYLNYTLRRIMTSDLVKPIFGEALNQLNNPYYTIVNDYVVFCNSNSGLRLFIEKYNFSLTMQNNVKYQQFSENLNGRQNIKIYFDASRLYHLLIAHVRPELHGKFTEDYQNYARMSPTGIQLNIHNGLLLMTAYSEYNPNSEVETSIAWKTELKAKVIKQPTVVLNHVNKEHEVLVQDEENRIYLINSSGKVLWERVLDGEILSEIYQIDIYTNDRLQYLFNTSSKIYLIDRNGKDVKNYPKRLGSEASNGLFVVDYDGKKNYRYFVACKNGNVYGYDKIGKPLDGWSPKTGLGTIEFPLQHFSVDDKDYLMAINNKGSLHYLKRNGGKRNNSVALKFKPNSPVGIDIEDEPYRIVSSNSKGKLFVANEKGKFFNLKTKVGTNDKVKFLYADVVEDERKDYILISGRNLCVYTYREKEFERVFCTEFEETQDELFVVKTEGDEKYRIGTLSKNKRKIYMLNEMGLILNDFPMAGTDKYAMANLFNDQSTVLVVPNGSIIYAYKLR